MRYILDTHVLLWSFLHEEKISEKAREIMLDKTLKKCISMASLWEISIKNRIGKLELENDMSDIFIQTESSGFGIIKIEKNHIEIYRTLPLIHRDPFDGIIIATAISEQMTIITADENIQRYKADWIW
jgi:PIN domain nuclease of toxin-antitoxin system